LAAVLLLIAAYLNASLRITRIHSPKKTVATTSATRPKIRESS
jgi:hypothetical protein